MARSAIISLSSASHIQHVLGSSSNFNIQAFEPKPSVISRLISSLLCTAMSESNRNDYYDSIFHEKIVVVDRAKRAEVYPKFSKSERSRD